MNHPAPEVHEALAEVLAAHENVECGHFAHGVKNWWSQCSGCDWSSPKHDERPTDRAADHRAHLASVLAAHFAEAVTEARAREYTVISSDEPSMPVGTTLIDKGSVIYRDWNLMDFESGESTGAVGQRLSRLCVECRIEHKTIGILGHDGECGSDDVKTEAGQVLRDATKRIEATR